MTLKIVSVSSPTSATTGQEICPAVVVSNDGTESVDVAIAWEGDTEIEFEATIELGPSVPPETIILDLNGDDNVNILDLTIARQKLASGEWSQDKYDKWEYAFYYGTFPVRPSQGTVYPNAKSMPDTSVTWKLNLLKLNSYGSGYQTTGISKTVTITNSGGSDNDTDGGDTSTDQSFLSRYKWYLVAAGVAIIGIIGGTMAWKKK